MKMNVRRSSLKPSIGMTIATAVASLTFLLIYPRVTFGQNPYAPLLSITRQREPQISVYGLQGAKYQLQFTPTLTTTNWQVLTNFILGTSAYTMVDPAAPAAGIRMYRALLLETNSSANYAPMMLTPAEIFRFSSQSAGIIVTETLVFNSPTSGVLSRQGSSANDGLFLVTITYTRVGPFLAQMSVIRPPTPGLPMSQTNSYTLVFTAPGAGYFQVTDSSATSYVGEFARDQSFVGQQIAPAQLGAGEMYSLLTTNGAISNLTTLVINSPTSGMLMSLGFAPGGGINPVSIQYSLLGPLSCQLQVVIPAGSGFPSPQTNLYYLVYTSANSGSYESISGPAMFSVGQFVADRSLVGQQIAPTQLGAGERYSLLTASAGISNVTTLVINSPTSGMLVTPGNPPPTGASIAPVSIEYLRLGPLSSQLQVVIPGDSGVPSPQTNLYYLVYTSANSGSYESISGPAMYTVGQFVADRSLVGQQIALAQLGAGEMYSLLTTNAGISNVTTLVINSPTSGVLISLGFAPVGSINPVSIQYSLLGPLSCQLQVVIPAGSGFPSPQTNLYYLVYTSTNSGSYQSLSAPAMYSVGQFVVDRSLVGQQIAPTQLTAGESYRLTSSNGPSVTVEVLIVNSPTDGILVHEGTDPDSGIFPNVALQYLTFGTLSGQIQAVIPPTPPMSSSRTNTYLLVYTTRDAGQFQRISDPAMVLLGQFRRTLAQ